MKTLSITEMLQKYRSSGVTLASDKIGAETDGALPSGYRVARYIQDMFLYVAAGVHVLQSEIRL